MLVMRVLALLAAVLTTVAVDAQQRPSFSEWLDGVRTEALSRGIKPAIVEEALGHIEEPMPVILERDRAQAEAVFSLEKYLTRHLTPKFVAMGREKFAEQRTLLDEVAATYDVPASIIVGVWGMETNYGRFSGVRPIVNALATLAWDPRRAAFFRGELFDALEILNRGDIDLPRMRGSWAGAMGQAQFMPSSYLKFAEDYDGDGLRDIWTSPADVFASIANYLKGHGWTAGQPWGREVRVPAAAARKIAATVARRAGTCNAKRDMTVPLPAAEWRALGVSLANGRPLPDSLPESAMVAGRTRYFLVFGNYDAILEYNCAHAYALSVGLLADRVSGASAAPAVATAATKKRPARWKR
jgi:peptidoglycan lytic transglycosylase B